MKKIAVSFGIVTIALFLSLGVNAQVIRTVAGNHIQGYDGDGAIAENAKIGTTSGITADASGNIYISDMYQSTIRKISTNGIITTIAGAPGHFGYTGDNGPAINATLFMPMGLAFDSHGNLFIADNGNSVIRKIDINGTITTVAGNGNWGFSGDGGLAVHAQINGGMAITFDIFDNMYIADGNVRVRKVNGNGIISTVAGGGGYGYSGDGGMATDAGFAGVQGVAVDGFGNLYISDALNNVIRKVNTFGIVSTIAGKHVAGYDADYLPATATRINSPHGITVDAAGNITFADQNNNRIRKIDFNGIITTIAGFGIGAYLGDGDEPSNATVTSPSDLFLNCRGNLLIADAGNFTIREIVYPGHTLISAVPGSSICAGVSTTLNATSTNNLYSVGYQWTLNGANVGTDSSSYINATLVNGDVVNCYIKDVVRGFILDSGTAIAMVVEPYANPTININTTIGDIVCQGTTVTYTANYTEGGTAPALIWSVNGTTAYTGSTFNYMPSNGDIITCVIHTNDLCALTDTATSEGLAMSVNQNVLPTAQITGSTGSIIMAGEPVIFTVAITNGGTTPAYQWVLNGINIPGETNTTYAVNALNEGDVVSCILTSNATCAITTNVISNNLTIIPSLGLQKDASITSTFAIIPNPNNGIFILKGNIPNTEKNNIHYIVTDMLGNTVYESNFVANNGTINETFNLLTNLPNGLYILVLNTDNNRYGLHFAINK